MKRILLAEDDQPVASFVSKSLTAERYQVDMAADGEQALDLATRHEYDLVILDVKLPKLDGFTALQRIREVKPNVCVLFLTGSAQVSDRVKGLDLGADDYLTKPFSLNELLARVRALARRGGRQSAAVLKVGDLVMDRVQRSVTRAGRSIHLTPRELALLEYLMRNADRPVSRSEIVEQVWSPGLESATNVVDVYINYLRKKVDGEAPVKLIRTIRGVGYKIGGEEGEQPERSPEPPDHTAS